MKQHIEDLTRRLAAAEAEVQAMKASRALRESEDRYRRIVDTMEQGVWVIDANAITVFANGSMAAMLGYDTATVIGVSARESISKDPSMSDEELRHRRQGFSGIVELELTRKDRSTFWAQMATVPIYTDSGDYDGALAIVTDMSERKRADALRAALTANLEKQLAERATIEKSLRLSEARHRSLFNAGLMLIMYFDPQGNIAEANDVTTLLLGYTHEDFATGKVSVNNITPPEWLAADIAAVKEFYENGFVRPFEKELFHKDGRRIPVLTGAALVEGNSGIGIAIDLTKLKAAENELTERLKVARLVGEIGLKLTRGTHLKEMLQHCAGSIVRHFDKSLVWIWMFDAKQHDLELQSSAGLPPEFDHLEVRIPVGSFLAGRVAEARKPFRTNDVVRDSAPGDPVWPGITAFAGYPLLVNDELVGVLAVSSPEPISEPYFTGLGSIADALALGIQRSLVKRANTELEAQLRQAQKMEAVGRLAGGIAHDFNNILTVILNYSQFLLADMKPADPARADVEEISKAGLRAASLTRQLLMFSRQQVLEPKILDLAAVVEGLGNMLQRVLGEDVELILQNAPDTGRTHIDRGSIEQVIINLAVNARDAMPQGGRLSIATFSEEIRGDHWLHQRCEIKNGPYTVLSVADTGTGMDVATRARIFEPFFTTKDASKGTGLGLSTVLGIVQQSNGAIHVLSEVGKGSTFRIYLPLVASLPDAAPALSTDTGLRGTETILLVEDEDQVRMVVRAILERQGYRVIEISTAREAILYCQSGQAPVHLLLTDVVMPQMSGPELASEIAKIVPQLGVLYMSGYTDDRMLRHGIQYADIAFVQKPFTYATLARKVREVLDARKDSRPEIS